MSLRALNRLFVVGLLLFFGWAATSDPQAWGQEELNRKVKNKVAPAYPELARRMNIAGVVKLLITVAPNGSVKDAKLVSEDIQCWQTPLWMRSRGGVSRRVRRNQRGLWNSVLIRAGKRARLCRDTG